MVLGHARIKYQSSGLKPLRSVYQTHFGFTAGKYNELHRRIRSPKYSSWSLDNSPWSWWKTPLPWRGTLPPNPPGLWGG